MSDLLRVLETPAIKTMQKIQELYNDVDEIEDEFSSTLSEIEEWDENIHEYEETLASAKRRKVVSEKYAQQAAAKIQKTRLEIRALALKLISEIDASKPATYGKEVKKKEKVDPEVAAKNLADALDTLSSREI